MRAEIMRKTVTALSAAWILWNLSSGVSSGGIKGIDLWTPTSGFETLKSCNPVEETASATSAENFRKKEKGYETWHCFPSDFDPRGHGYGG